MLKMKDSTLASIRTYLGFHWIRMHGSTQTHFMPSADFFKSQTHIGMSCWHILGFYVTLIKLMLPYQEIFAFRLQDITIFVKGVFILFFSLFTLDIAPKEFCNTTHNVIFILVYCYHLMQKLMIGYQILPVRYYLNSLNSCSQSLFSIVLMSPSDFTFTSRTE